MYEPSSIDSSSGKNKVEPPNEALGIIEIEFTWSKSYMIVASNAWPASWYEIVFYLSGEKVIPFLSRPIWRRSIAS